MNDLTTQSTVAAPSRLAAAVLMLLAMTVLPCVAQHQATLVMKNQTQSKPGIVRYLPASRSYEFNDGTITRTVKASEVDKVILTQPPAGLQQAVQQVNSGNYQAPIAVLQQIAAAYTMMGPDVVASQALALAYLRTSRTKDALKICEDLVKNNPDALLDGNFASVYWETLLAEGKTAALRASLRTAVETGGREVAAVAQVRRGDLEMQEKKPREALLDGYLRTILLFQDVTFIQPEALSKAIKAHEDLNEVQYAERWRKRLLGSFGDSEYAKKFK